MKRSTILLAMAAALALGCSRGGESAEANAPAGARPASDTLALAPGPAPAESGPAAGDVPDSASISDAEASGARAPAGGARPAEGGPAGTATGGSGSPEPAAAPAASQADSASRILERAAARYAEVSSLQADFTMVTENPILRTRIEGAGVLYQKRPDRLLLRFSEPAGDIVLSDGQYFWLYYPSLQPDQVVRAAASASGRSGVDLQAQFLGDPTRRFSYTLDGEESVRGRRAWQLTMKPRERMGYRQLRVWIDQRDYLARRFEIQEDNGAVRRFELSNLRIDPALRDALFHFDVPAGVRVIAQ